MDINYILNTSSEHSDGIAPDEAPLFFMNTYTFGPNIVLIVGEHRPSR